MRILVTGYGGQLGYDVVQVGTGIGFNMIGVGREQLDITEEQSVNDYVNQIRPDAIIHCAAYTGVDKAESDREACQNTNVVGTEYLVKAAKQNDAKFMYISTDYVFDGEGTGPFKESDPPNPITYYGLTKYEGELAVQRGLEEWFIVRISWVFGRNGHNFINTILRLAETRDQLNIVCDQTGSPTYTLDLARLLIEMIQTNKFGIYHASNEGYCSWAEFAEEIIRLTGKDVKINRIATEEYPTPAVRPKNSRMSKQKLADNGFRRLPDWQDALERYLQEVKL